MNIDDHFRTVPCSHCGGDGGHHDFAGRWSRCEDCDATGIVDICIKPIEINDLDRALCGLPITSGIRESKS